MPTTYRFLKTCCQLPNRKSSEMRVFECHMNNEAFPLLYSVFIQKWPPKLTSRVLLGIPPSKPVPRLPACAGSDSRVSPSACQAAFSAGARAEAA